MASQLTASERQRLLYAQLQQEGRLEIRTLAERLQVSEMTVRRDVRDLESNGLARLERGWVFPRERNQRIWELPVSSRLHLHAREKRRIAEAAKKLLQPGQTVGFDGSTTALHVAQAVEGIENLTIVTNSILLAAVVGPRNGVDLIVTGGIARRDSLDLLGDSVEQMIRHFNLDLFFMSGLGVDREKGVTENHLLEIRAKQAFIAVAKRVIVLADHTKLGRVALATSCPVSSINLLITDDGASPERVRELTNAGVEVMLAGSTDDG